MEKVYAYAKSRYTLLYGMKKTAEWRQCCKMLKAQELWTCKEHQDRFDCPDALISYIPKFREYGLIVHDGGKSHVAIDYCPWCGSSFPEALRDKWFEEIEALGIEPDGNDIPEKYNSDVWWR